MNEIEKFYNSLRQEISTIQFSQEEGESQEQAFTRICLDMLTQANETDNAVVAYDEKIVMKSNLEEALYAMFGESAPQSPELENESTENVEDHTLTYESVASRVVSEFEKLKKASSENDWNAFGSSLKALESSVEELKKSIGN